jgi:hypothetical protein
MEYSLMVRFAVAGIVALALAGPVAAKTAPTMPIQVRGIWMTDNAEGRSQCQRYLKAVRTDNGEASPNLVGSEVISAKGLHSYAEYGEGNFYAPTRITILGRQTWRVNTALGIDGPPEPKESGRAVFTLSIIGGKLAFRMESVNNKPVSGKTKRQYFRCADVPKGLSFS